MDILRLKAFAKVNLGLDVLHKRPDGYHEVRMIMQTVRVYDRLELVKQTEPGIRVKTNLYYLPTDEKNLVFRAAKLLMKEFDIREGLSILLDKHIPVAAGMAGGSADAAAVLYGINRMYRLGLEPAQLMERGVKIGADIPYCLFRGTALAEGLGEKLTRLSPMPQCHVLIAKPGVSVSTAFVYGNLNIPKLDHPDINGMVKYIYEGDLKSITSSLGNVLETVTIPRHPIIGVIKAEMKAGGAMGVLMSGSGPSVFGLFEEKRTAYAVLRTLRQKRLAKDLFVTDFYNVK